MNQKPLVLRIAAWPMLFLAAFLPAQIWSWLAGTKLLLEYVPSLTESAASVMDGLVFVVGAVYALLAIPMLMPSGFRNWYLAIFIMGANVFTICTWYNWLTLFSDGNLDFMTSVIVMTVTMIFNISAAIKFLMREK